MTDAIDRIVADLADRSGLHQVWCSIDEATQEEIKTAWRGLLAEPGTPKMPDPQLVAKAFEVVLPQHMTLAISHNDHKPVGAVVQAFYDPGSFINVIEHMKATTTQEVWTLEMVQQNGTGMLVRAATLPALVAWLVQQGLSYGG